MKKIISVFLVLSILFAFAGCSGPNADMTEKNVTETVDTAFEALKTFDAEALDTYVDSKTLSFIIAYAKQHSQFETLGKAMFKHLEYQITSIDLDAKTVTISVKNKDMAQVAADFAEELLANYSTVQLLGLLNNNVFLDTSLKELTDGISASKMQSDAVTVTLSIRQEKKNLVLYFDNTAENAVSGGALSAVEQIAG